MRRVRVRGGEGEEIVKLHNYRAASEGGNASPAGGHLMCPSPHDDPSHFIQNSKAWAAWVCFLLGLNKILVMIRNCYGKENKSKQP